MTETIKGAIIITVFVILAWAYLFSEYVENKQSIYRNNWFATHGYVQLEIAEFGKIAVKNEDVTKLLESK